MMINSILITGGGSGIGAALAICLAARGCHVIVAGRREKPLQEVAKNSAKITPIVADITKSDDQNQLIKALSELPGPRAIFHGAGYFQLGMLETLTPLDWQRSFDVNVTARWALSHKSAAFLEGGRVLFIGSDAGKNPRAGAAAYSIAQSASETLRRALQREWDTQEISVAGFKPGLVDTDMVRGFLASSDTVFPSRNDYQAYLDRGEIAKPETIASFAMWLLLELDTHEFTSRDWDIRDVDHHSAWLDGELYSRIS